MNTGKQEKKRAWCEQAKVLWTSRITLLYLYRYFYYNLMAKKKEVHTIIKTKIVTRKEKAESEIKRVEQKEEKVRKEKDKQSHKHNLQKSRDPIQGRPPEKNPPKNSYNLRDKNLKDKCYYSKYKSSISQALVKRPET